jgi:hypothetical protein
MRDGGMAMRAVLWGPVFGDSFAGSEDLGNVMLIPAISIVLALILVIGARRLIRSAGGAASTLVLSPPALTLLASALQAYPISARTTVFFMPILLILTAAGLDDVAGHIRKPLILKANILILALPLLWVTIRELTRVDPRENAQPLIEAVQKHRRPGEPVYVFAGAIPAWAIYSTDWRSPDLNRLEFLKRIASAGGPAFENAPSRRVTVREEADKLIYVTPAGVELYGSPSGLEASVFGLTNARPDSGWSENEARRIRQAAAPSIWLMFSHFYGPEGELLDVLKAAGGRSTYQDLRNGAAVIRYEFPR